MLNETRVNCVKAIEPLFFGTDMDSVVRNLVLKVDVSKSLVYQVLLLAEV